MLTKRCAHSTSSQKLGNHILITTHSGTHIASSALRRALGQTLNAHFIHITMRRFRNVCTHRTPASRSYRTFLLQFPSVRRKRVGVRACGCACAAREVDAKLRAHYASVARSLAASTAECSSSNFQLSYSCTLERAAQWPGMRIRCHFKKCCRRLGRVGGGLAGGNLICIPAI